MIRGGRARLALVGLLATASALLFGCSGPAVDPERPHLVLLMLDAARADSFSSYGHPVDTTPAMDRMAGRGMRFTQHFSHGHTTRQSLPQLFTSRYDAPSLLYFPPGQEEPWWRRDEPLQDDAVLLPELLGEAGYRTVMVTAHPWTLEESRFGREFQEVYFLKPETGPYADADRLVRRAREILDEHRNHSGVPLFLYVHFLDSHTPHNPEEGEFFSLDALDWSPAEWARKQPAVGGRTFLPDPDPVLLETFHGAVRASLHELDREIGRLVDDIERALGSKVVFSITSDHGDALGEGGYFEHTFATFGMDATHHIPWILFGEGLPEGRVVDGMTATVDVMPTLLRLVDVAPPADARLDGNPVLDSAGSVSTRTWIPYTYRIGWQQSRLGYRDAEQTLLLTERAEVWRVRGHEQEFLGLVPDLADSLPKDFLGFIRTYRRHEAARRAETESRRLHVSPWELEVPPGEVPACWQIGETREWREQISFVGRAEGCEPLRIGLSLPAGEYRASWRVQARGDASQILFRHSGGALMIEADGETAVDLGRIRHPGERWVLEVRVAGTGSRIDFRGMDWERLGSEAVDEDPVDDEALEQLKSLGYLD